MVLTGTIAGVGVRAREVVTVMGQVQAGLLMGLVGVMATVLVLGAGQALVLVMGLVVVELTEVGMVLEVAVLVVPDVAAVVGAAVRAMSIRQRTIMGN